MTLIWAGALLSVLAVQASSEQEPNRTEERHHVIIIGAGVSGFTATATLLDNNVTDVLVLEAADRMGGRINTVEFGGVLLDKGAEFVHGEKDNAVYEMVSPYDLLFSYETIIDPDKFLIANLSGHGFRSPELIRIINESYSIFHEEAIFHSNLSMADYFNSRIDAVLEANKVDTDLSEAIRFCAPLLECQNEGCNTDLSEIPATSEYWENEGDQYLKWKPGSGGYKTIFDFISKKFPRPEEELPVLSKILLEKRVTRVTVREPGPEGASVEVSCADGSTYLADHVVSTVSLGVLKKHHADLFQPPLPPKKVNSIEKLGIGCAGKVFLLFPTRWWGNDTNIINILWSNSQRETFSKSSPYASWTPYVTEFLTVVDDERMLCVWFTGEACRTMELLTETQVTEGLLELLRTVLGKDFTVPVPEAILRSNWASNPYTLGAYSYHTVAFSREGLNNTDLAQPVLQGEKPVLLFAGEATHPHYFSTVHGALETGRREANRILDYMAKSR